MNATLTEELIHPYVLERGKPMPSKSHSIAQMNLGGEFLKDRRYRPMSELALRLDGKLYFPDISVYPRVANDFSRDQTEVTDPPLHTVEIYSPNQGYNAVMEKAQAYLAAGVKTCWVVDPFQRTVTIFPAEGEPVTFVHGQVATDPVSGLKADLAEVFS